MTLNAINWALERNIKTDKHSAQVQKVVLIALATYTNYYGETSPPMTAIEKSTGLHKNTVTSVVLKLIEGKHIKDTGRFSGPTGQDKIYKLAV